ncbi:putative Zn-dependent protease [Flavobacterium sp. 7E]|uniref:M48 family metallopeptidase n=1 Tax=Flavobacterium sp. 7E TaxID=2735898 RepID=UPI00156D4674|nr:M48 family metallopeptidase [Flavobacterium sp. 7E]NRS89773.1 putative Zn-dependent protease [Flavobacterium sp. 7E]
MMQKFLPFLLFFTLISYSQTYTPFDTTSVAKKKLFLEELKARKDLKIKLIKQDFSGKISREMIAVYDSQFDDFSRNVNENELYFDEKLNAYATKIVSYIKEKNTELNGTAIKVYFSRNSEANAYSIGDGTIILNMGLIAYAKEESEIIFTICHEIAHFILDHRGQSIEKNIVNLHSKENEEKEKEIKKSKFNKQIKAQALAKNTIYSRKSKSRMNEFQADSLGFIYFKKLQYNTATSLKLLEHLSNSDEELDSLSLKAYPKYFNTKNQKFIPQWMVREDFSNYSYSKESVFKWDVDSLKTHPNCDERIARLKNLVVDKKSNFYIDKEFFKNLKDRMSYEQVFNQYYLKEYGKSLYSTLKQKETHPKDKFLDNMMASNLDALAKAKKEMRMNTYVPLIDPTEHTKSQQYYLNFISNLTLSELERLATDYKNLQ